MVRRCVWALVLLAVPSIGWAQSPDRFLPPGSQLYFRWDGFEAHRADFDKTAVGKMMKGDTGTFLSALVEYIGKQIDSLLGQFDPQAAQIVKDVGKIIDVAGKHGFTLAVEIKDVKPPDVQAAFVLSKNGENVVGLLKTAIVKGGGDVKETKVGQATVYHVQPAPGLHLGWMNAGGDFVFLAGTHDPVTVAKVPAKKIAIAGNTMYKDVTGFKEFPTWCRGYVDIAGIAAVVKKINPDVKTLVEELGIDGIKSITFQSGFDGPAERSITELTTQGQRKGLLKLASTKAVSLKDLPPMPDDITSFSISSLNLAEMYDAVVQSAEAAVKIFAPNEAAKIKEIIKQAEGFIGVKLRDDLLASLGDVCVTYNSPAEGLLRMGAVTLVKVKDGQKLGRSLDGLFKTLQLATAPFGVDFSVRKKTYEGADLFELHAKAAGNFTLPTYTIHKGWFAFANYPQPLKGFVLRTNGELTSYDVKARLGKRLDAFPKEFVSLSVSDPRPTVKFLLSLAPPAMSLLNGLSHQFLPAAPQFDVTLIPNVHEATRHLFPNITVTTDDGTKVRMDTRASLNLPF